MSIVITGATGQLGRLVVEQLLAAGTPPDTIVATGRDTNKLTALSDDGVTVIDSTPGNGVEPQWDATIGTGPKGVGGCSTRLSCGRGSSRRPGYPIVGAAGQIWESGGERPRFVGRAFRSKSAGHRCLPVRGVRDKGRRG